MTITAVIAISVFSTLATIALLLFAMKHFLRRGLQQHRQIFPDARRHNDDLRDQHLWHGKSGSKNQPLDWVDSILQLDAQQLTLWNTLKQAIIDSQQDLATYGEILTGADDVEQSVNRWEDFIQDSLIEFRKIKPKLIEFYQSLSEQQRQKVNAWLSRNSVNTRNCGFRC